MFAAQKNCKINLSSLFASPRQAKMSQSCSSLLVKPHVSTTHKVENGVDKEMGGEKTKKRSSRETKVPSKLSDYGVQSLRYLSSVHAKSMSNQTE